LDHIGKRPVIVGLFTFGKITFAPRQEDIFKKKSKRDKSSIKRRRKMRQREE